MHPAGGDGEIHATNSSVRILHPQHRRHPIAHAHDPGIERRCRERIEAGAKAGTSPTCVWRLWWPACRRSADLDRIGDHTNTLTRHMQCVIVFALHQGVSMRMRVSKWMGVVAAGIALSACSADAPVAPPQRR